MPVSGNAQRRSRLHWEGTLTLADRCAWNSTHTSASSGELTLSSGHAVPSNDYARRMMDDTVILSSRVGRQSV